MGVRACYRVSRHWHSYRTIRQPSDSLSRWRWDRASEAQAPANSESMEAFPDLLPDGDALMWTQVSLVSPAWLGLCYSQDTGMFRPLNVGPGSDGPPLHYVKVKLQVKVLLWCTSSPGLSPPPQKNKKAVKIEWCTVNKKQNQKQWAHSRILDFFFYKKPPLLIMLSFFPINN